jgi:hypothetical protein
MALVLHSSIVAPATAAASFLPGMFWSRRVVFLFVMIMIIFLLSTVELVTIC